MKHFAVWHITPFPTSGTNSHRGMYKHKESIIGTSPWLAVVTSNLEASVNALIRLLTHISMCYPLADDTKLLSQ